MRSFLKLVHIKDYELKPITAVPHAVKTDFYAEFVGMLGSTIPTSADSIKVNKRRYGAIDVLDATSEEIPGWQDDIVD